MKPVLFGFKKLPGANPDHPYGIEKKFRGWVSIKRRNTKKIINAMRLIIEEDRSVSVPESAQRIGKSEQHETQRSVICTRQKSGKFSTRMDGNIG